MYILLANQMTNFVEICVLPTNISSITKLNAVERAYYIYESRFMKESGTKGCLKFENSI